MRSLFSAHAAEPDHSSSKLSVCLSGFRIGLVFILCTGFWPVTGPAAAQQEERDPAAPADALLDRFEEAPDDEPGQPTYVVDDFIIELRREHPDLPTPSAIVLVPIELSKMPWGYDARSYEDDQRVSLQSLGEGEAVTLSLAALDDVVAQITEFLDKPGREDLSVEVDARQIAPESGEDKRAAQDRSLRLVVDVSVPRYQISGVELTYVTPHPQLPPLETLQALEVKFSQYEDGLVSRREDMGKPVELGLGAFDRPRSMYPSAVRTLSVRVVDHFNEDLRIIGVFVRPVQDDLDAARESPTTLRLGVHIATVSKIRTIAGGDRVPVEQRIDHRWHREIRKDSPLQPSGDEGDGQPGALIDRRALDQYIFRLNRHPGRGVESAISASRDQGAVVLDYLVSENKPWSVFAQVSNTGTAQTAEWRERFSFVHNQLTNNDDIFRVDYVTANFDSSHAVIGSYEAPFGGWDRLRWQVRGMWNEFTASEVGQADEVFFGEGWMLGGRLTANVFQYRDLFVDLYAGARWEHTEVRNETFAPALIVEGETDFFIPEFGLVLERSSNRYQTMLDVGVEFNLPGVAGTDEAELQRLGRSLPEESWTKVRWDLRHSFFLEPVLWPEAWRDPLTSESSTLAHELALTFRGQWVIDETRVVPTQMMTAGGFHTVRGYEESVVSGDTVLIGSVEYRFHLPQILPLSPPDDLFGQSFRLVPQTVYGAADWDFIVRAFFDVGQTVNNERISGLESDQTLMGAGIGAELRIRNNFSVRADWGFALSNRTFTTGESVEVGDDRVHLSATLLY